MRKSHVEIDVSELHSKKRKRMEKRSVSWKPKQKAKLNEYYVSVDSEEQSSGMSERLARKGRIKHRKGKSTRARESETVESEEDGGKSDRFNHIAYPDRSLRFLKRY